MSLPRSAAGAPVSQKPPEKDTADRISDLNGFCRSGQTCSCIPASTQGNGTPIPRVNPAVEKGFVQGKQREDGLRVSLEQRGGKGQQG